MHPSTKPFWEAAVVRQLQVVRAELRLETRAERQVLHPDLGEQAAKEL